MQLHHFKRSMPIGVDAPSDVTAGYPARLVTADVGRPLTEDEGLVRLDEVRVVDVERDAPGGGRVRDLHFHLVSHRHMNLARDHIRALAHHPVPGRAPAQPSLAVLAHVGEAKVFTRSEEHTSELQSRQYLVC